ncbi:MAG: hypothetical protein ACRYGF_12770 [Janthinobacterium lividum]
MAKHPDKYAAILVGGGPAGIAVLLSAHRDGMLTDLLQQGLLLVERSATLGSGHIGEYAINSDSDGVTFLDALRAAQEPVLQRILDTPVASRMASAAAGSVPLQDVGELMVLIGDAMRALIQQHPQSRVLTRCTADFARACQGDLWEVNVTSATGEVLRFQTPRLVLATGARQPIERLAEERVAGKRVRQRWGNRLRQSGEVLGRQGLQQVADLLQGKHNPRVAILGGSTSAMAVAHALLHRLPRVSFSNSGITVFHRKPLRLYYASEAEAIQDGYTDFGANDFCPVTNRLYRFAGLRLDSRELLMQVLRVGGQPPEPRVTLHQIEGHDTEAIRRIDKADLVVAAFGYRPNALRLLDQTGRPVPLLAHTGPSASLVDDRCRVLKADGTPLPGVYGIGLAAGYRPSGRFGGEPSFCGQVNGLWLWQNGIGSIIAKALLTSRPALPASADTAKQIVELPALARGPVRIPAMGAA